MPHWWDGWAPGWGIAMMVAMFLFWVAILVGLALLIRWLYLRSSEGRPLLAGGPPSETALDILKKRYARGEISREEYERMRQELS